MIRSLAILGALLLSVPANARDVSIAWDASAEADAYNVYRADRVADEWTAWQLLATNQTALTYIDTTAPDGCAMWVVTATKGSAESGASNPATDCQDAPPAPPMNARLQ